MDFLQELKNRVEKIEEIITAYMPKECTLQQAICEVMNYTMSAGGKRIRPMLMQESYELFRKKNEFCEMDVPFIEGNLVEPFMAAIEMIHTYSLIHDDLPALDNDDYRRGKETAHKKYGEDMAILAGDALLNYAFETAGQAFDMVVETEGSLVGDSYYLMQELKVRKRIERAMQVLAKKPGIYGMIGGQVVDVKLTGVILDEEQLTYIYENKTGALIEASMMIGAILAGADEDGIEKIQKVAYNIGMAFQIQDDILDEISTFEELGKAIHSDEKNGKVTYVTLHGIENSKKEVERLSKEANTLLDSLEGDSEFLQELVEYLIDRKN